MRDMVKSAVGPILIYQLEHPLRCLHSPRTSGDPGSGRKGKDRGLARKENLLDRLTESERELIPRVVLYRLGCLLLHCSTVRCARRCV